MGQLHVLNFAYLTELLSGQNGGEEKVVGYE